MSVDLEKILRPVEQKAPLYTPKFITLASGEHMVVRQVDRDVMPDILQYIKPMIDVQRDFYDLVGVRLYSELLGYYEYRVQDEYVLVCQIDGELAAVVNGRSITPEIGLSYHTIALRRGLRVGAHAFASKMEYHFDFLKHKEVRVVAESPIGFRRWMLEYKLEKRFDTPHELGGVPSWALTKGLYDAAKHSLIVGKRPVPPEMLAKAEEAILPPTDPPKMPEDLLAATRAQRDSTGTSLMRQKWAMEGKAAS